MKLVPAGNRVVLERDKPEDSKVGRIHVPEVAKKKSSACTVVAVGPGRRMQDGRIVEPPFKAGDRVQLGEWEGVEVPRDLGDRNPLLVVDADAILGHWQEE